MPNIIEVPFTIGQQVWALTETHNLREMKWGKGKVVGYRYNDNLKKDGKCVICSVIVKIGVREHYCKVEDCTENEEGLGGVIQARIDKQVQLLELHITERDKEIEELKKAIANCKAITYPEIDKKDIQPEIQPAAENP
jgi:hypothetical protein